MPISDKDQTTALIHLYRGELGRMTSYRLRLDNTTNWSVGVTAGITSFALGRQETPHTVFALALLHCTAFMVIEARRFRIYALVLERVRLLEQGFYGEVLGTPNDGTYLALLSANLRNPESPITLFQSIAVRLWRNYLWLLAAITAAWLVKLVQNGNPLETAAVGAVPGPVVLGAVAVLFGVATAVGFTQRATEEG